jgi:hypothetical protein
MDTDSAKFEPSEPTGSSLTEADVLTRMIQEMQRLDVSSRRRILATLSTFFGIEILHMPPNSSMPRATTEIERPERAPHSQSQETWVPNAAFPRSTSLSEDRTISAKEFIMYKEPRTDVERVACLGYYLTHYASMKHFKTLDISQLNTEAGQLKFANAAATMDNATHRSKFFILGDKGSRQISAIGELFVEALPDRDAAKKVLAKSRPKRRGKKSDSIPDEKAE